MEEIFNFIKSIYNSNDIPLHQPQFIGNEKKYLNEVIDSTYVSSIGPFIDMLEDRVEKKFNFLGVTSVVNGTSALDLSLKIIGVRENDEVITQALSFIATTNSILYNKAIPIYIDVDIDTMGLSPVSLKNFLEESAEIRDGSCFNIKSNRKIAACIPMHTFGFPNRIYEIKKICKKWKIKIIEDAAEAMGSKIQNKYVGGIGSMGIFSLNGNKIVTSGGGGLIISNRKNKKIAKHLSTTAKLSKGFEFIHTQLGYNLRMPNINAALALAQFEKLDYFIQKKRRLAVMYENFFFKKGIEFIKEPKNTFSNYWLMSIRFENKRERDKFLKLSNKKNIFTRPPWELNSKMSYTSQYHNENLSNSELIQRTVLNIPSSVY